MIPIIDYLTKFLFSDLYSVYVFGFLLVLFAVYYLPKINIIAKPFYQLGYLIHQWIGYGSCIECGQKRKSMWLLVCNTCYESKVKKVK